MAIRARKLSAVFACLFVVALLACVLWMSLNLSHSCHDKYCPICAQLELVENTFRRFSVIALFALSFVIFVYCTTCLLLLCRLSWDFRGTLVSQKVKLSN